MSRKTRRSESCPYQTKRGLYSFPRRERTGSLGGTAMRGLRAFAVLLIIHASICVSRGLISDEQLYKWVNASTLTFTGTILEIGASNVSGIDSKDSMIVQVEKVYSGDQQAVGDLRGSELTVAVSPNSRNGLRNNISAVFFADPLVYETNIGLVANDIAVIERKNAEDFSTRLQAAAVQKSEAPLRSEVASADLIVTGEVEAVRPLASNKAADLRLVHNGWELRSEHRPRWKEAVIKVQTVEKGTQTPTATATPTPTATPELAIVVFPSTHDCFGESSPKFEVKQSGIWLLHRHHQLDDQEAEVLLRSENFDGQEIQSYTALAPADFQDLAKLDRIRQMIKRKP